MFKVGQKVELNGETYTIAGTVKRSFLLEKGGKRYKATASKMKRIQDQNAGPSRRRQTERQTRSTGTRHMEERLKWMKMFKSNGEVKLPETDAEFEDWAEHIACDLSPENLTCDGELSGGQVRARSNKLYAELKEFETLAGRSFEPL